jgi:beta-galactosidase
VAARYDDTGWRSVFSGLDQAYPQRPAVYRGRIDVELPKPGAAITLFLPALGETETVYLNGRQLGGRFDRGAVLRGIPVAPAYLVSGGNSIAVVAQLLALAPRSYDRTSPGSIRVVTPAAGWQRSAFNGLAAVIIQAGGNPGDIILTARAPGLEPARLVLATRRAGP